MCSGDAIKIAALGVMEADVGLLNPTVAVEDYMLGCLAMAERALDKAGITLDAECPADIQLLAMYAAWLYRNRVKGDAKPEMLRSEMRNRQISGAVEVAE